MTLGSLDEASRSDDGTGIMPASGPRLDFPTPATGRSESADDSPR